MKFFATTPRGLEQVLAAELEAMHVDKIQPDPGGVAFEGALSAGYRATLCSRSATRILWQIAAFDCPDEEALYRRTRTIDWPHYFDVSRTFAVSANTRDSAITHSHYAALKIKDAVADRFRMLIGKRPDVDTSAPDVLINAHIKANRCTLSLDMAGRSLHKRGYRQQKGEAPLNETLAAGLIRLTAYSGEETFIDAMCGSGTIAIEAALYARRIPPGLSEKRFSFQTWRNFKPGVWRKIQQEAQTVILPRAPAPIIAADISERMLEIARRNAENAGVREDIDFRHTDIAELTCGGPAGVVICNPPYGARLGAQHDLQDLYRTIGNTYKRNFRGFRGFVFTGNFELLKFIGLKTSRRRILFNGPIESRLLSYELY